MPNLKLKEGQNVCAAAINEHIPRMGYEAVK